MKEGPAAPKQEQPVDYPDLAREILKMAETDQAMRSATVKDAEKWDPEIDAENTARMEEIVRLVGWPTKTKVGEPASHMAWPLIQHADTQPEFQRTCLELMKKCPGHDIIKNDMAYLEDRVRTKETGTQIYGTQFRHLENGTFEYWPIEDEERLDARRAALGLEPFAEYRARIIRKNQELDTKRY